LEPVLGEIPASEPTHKRMDVDAFAERRRSRLEAGEEAHAPHHSAITPESTRAGRHLFSDTTLLILTEPGSCTAVVWTRARRCACVKRATGRNRLTGQPNA